MAMPSDMVTTHLHEYGWVESFIDAGAFIKGDLNDKKELKNLVLINITM